MEIPADGLNLFQVLITDEPEQDLLATPVLRANRESFTGLHPELRAVVLGQREIRAVLAARLEPAVLAAFDALVPYAFKADLARYCLLFLFGGVYADLSMRLLSRFALPEGKGLFCFRDAYANGGSSWSVSNGLIHAAPGRPELRAAIDMVVENHRTLNYGASVLHPTGPALFGRAIAVTDRGAELEVGDFRNLTGTTHPLSYGYVDGTGRLLCVRMKEAGGDLALMGVRGVNMYDAVWRLGTVWGEALVLDAADERLKLLQCARDAGGIRIGAEASGCVVFGPYVYMPPGRFVGTYRFAPGFVGGGVVVDVVTEAGVVAEVAVSGPDAAGEVSIGFELARLCPTLQVRLSVEPGSAGYCTGLVIARVAGL